MIPTPAATETAPALDETRSPPPAPAPAALRAPMPPTARYFLLGDYWVPGADPLER